MQTPRNEFKDAITKPGVQIGLWLGLPDPVRPNSAPPQALTGW